MSAKIDFNNLKKEIMKVVKSSGGSGGGIPRNPVPGNGRVLGLALGLGLLGFGLYNSVFQVQGGERAIKFNRIFGVGEKHYDEGIKFLIPFLERPIIYDVKARPTSITSPTGSRDLQTVHITVRILHRPDANNLPFIYRNLGKDYSERVLPSIANEVLKSVVAQFTAAELMSTKRSEVSGNVAERLKQRGKEFGILIEDVSVINLVFGAEYSQAVESKQVAAQDAERAKFWVDRAKQEKLSMILKAEGEAAAIRMVGEAMKGNSGFLQLRRIDAAKEIAQTISKAPNKVYLSSDQLLLNLAEGVLGTNDDKKKR
jgi:prohibitin 2